MSRKLGTASSNLPSTGIGTAESATVGGPALMGSAHGAFRLGRCPGPWRLVFRAGFAL